MKKAFAILGVYLLGISLCVALCLYANSATPLLKNGDALPEDIDERQYLLTELSPEPDAGEYEFRFLAKRSAPPLVLTVSDTGPISLYNGDRLIYRYAPGDRYNRNLSVDLGVPSEGAYLLRLRMDAQNKEAGELLLGNSSVLKVLLGARSAQTRTAERYQQIVALCAGLYLMLILSSLTLYARCTQEKYLLALAFVALASLAVMLIDSYAPLFHITQEHYARIRSSLFICPVIFTAAIGFYLLYTYIPESCKPFLTLRNLLLVTALIMAAQYFSRYNLNYAVRILLMAPLLILFARGAVKNAPGVRLMAMGCGVADGARLMVYLVNTLGVAHAGETLIYLRVTQMGYLAYLIICMVVIYGRFSAKFTQAHVLVETLDAKVEDRTARLREANVQLEAIRKREHEMMTNVLHDLRTPIFHLQGCLDMLEVENGKQAQTVLLMRERTEYLKNLAENLFLAAKLEEGHITFNRHEVNITSVCGYVAEGARMGAQAKNIRFVRDLPSLPLIVSDGFRIRQVLENLLDNAVKYTPYGGEIYFSLRGVKDGVLIEVSNSGDGMTPEVLSRVFDRFYHGAGSSSSGLGLYIAKTLMDRMGGTITANSAEGLTTFTVRIMRAEADEWEE